MRWLLPILVLKALILAWIISNSHIGLAPDEAQYWTWSRSLDWGYYSKPPGIAWQIWLTTYLFGNTELGVRFGALLVGFCLSLVVYAATRWAGLEKKTALWAALIAAFSPLGVYLSFAATTDGGAILFFTLAAAITIRGMPAPNYVWVGLCILVGALFKWTAFLFWPFLLFFLLFFKEMRKIALIGGMALSLLAFIPSLYWNASHEWATFKHVGATVTGEAGGNVLDFLGAQVALLSPLFFLLLVMGYFFLRRNSPQGLLFAALFPLAILIYLGMAFFRKMQPNWAAFLYPPGLMLAAWCGYEKLKGGRLWLQMGLALSLLMLITAFSIPWLQTKNVVPVPYKFNPFRQSVGWEKLGPALTDAGYNPNTDFLFGDKYQAASLLSFYAPGQKRAYFFNLGQSRKNQFSYWPQMEQKEVGKTGYFVLLENTDTQALPWYITHYQNQLQPYFEHITFSGAYPLYTASGTPVKYALIFRAQHYLGTTPTTPQIHY